MDFYDVIRKRRSIRGYRNDLIPDESLDRIAEAVSLAPSACNLQPWSFRVVFDPELREKICSCYTRDWLKQAPAIVLALGNYEECWKRPEGTPIIDIDIGIAMEHFVLAAQAEGLSTCWICAYEIGKMNRALNIMSPWSILAISPLGYSDAEPRELERKKREDIFRVFK